MSNNFETVNVHIYKPKRWTLALNIFSLFFVGIIMGIPLIGFVLMIVSIFRAEKGLDTYTILLGCTLIPIIILLVFNIIQMTINVFMSFFSYIKISPNGIEQKNSPSKHIRCNWSDIDRLGKFNLFRDVLYLNSFEIVGMSYSLKSPFRFFLPRLGFIALTGYDGWPDGELANDLKQYVPKLFENQPVSEENKEVQEVEALSVNQEVRLLAAISHASVLFPNIGVFVPIVIYLTQKKKSSYLGFQALQALIWQIGMFLFSILTSSCMTASILIPILLTTASKNERLLELSNSDVFGVAVFSVFLMIGGNLVFVINGIIGAVMTYQGKDFHYVFIGNLIEKSKGARSTNRT